MFWTDKFGQFSLVLPYQLLQFNNNNCTVLLRQLIHVGIHGDTVTVVYTSSILTVKTLSADDYTCYCIIIKWWGSEGFEIRICIYIIVEDNKDTSQSLSMRIPLVAAFLWTSSEQPYMFCHTQNKILGVCDAEQMCNRNHSTALLRKKPSEKFMGKGKTD